MKIGFSLGRCVRDIVRGDVAIEDVAFIIAATNVHDPEQLVAVVEQYMYRDEYLYGLDEAECQQVALDLWKSNRLLQPRRQGMHRHMQPESSVWVDIFPTALSTNESVKSSWNAYRFMLQMIENVDNDAIEIFK
jgi:hypothetical protein